ncbi:hypothetical protein PoB_006260600 [Plakobranchus ocellatus]|uniref:Uncharacterized protein n=1 Tax=Plakobranchus ocellatus TaxID=259542 RepID=A0AAV4CW16_9GAST|nr:hypothetical protein PoB_006260600 [Plakobranchus ocellatus]
MGPDGGQCSGRPERGLMWANAVAGYLGVITMHRCDLHIPSLPQVRTASQHNLRQNMINSKWSLVLRVASNATFHSRSESFSVGVYWYVISDFLSPCRVQRWRRTRDGKFHQARATDAPPQSSRKT